MFAINTISKNFMEILVLKRKIKNCLDKTKEKHSKIITDHNLNEYAQFEYSTTVDKANKLSLERKRS